MKSAVLIMSALLLTCCGQEKGDAAPETPASKQVGRYEPRAIRAVDSDHRLDHRTRLMLLGTGTPYPDPDASGPSAAVIVDGKAYVFDAGAGVVRRAAAAYHAGERALEPTRLSNVFITHLHSDHTLGYPDLIFTPWVVGRDDSLKAYGPRGLQKMTDAITDAWSEDIAVRTHRRPHAAKGAKPLVREITPGTIFEEGKVKISAFEVKHGVWEQAYGYKIEGPDRTIVISGDTTPCEATIKACDGCDILLHEVYALKGFGERPADWRHYHETSHTSTHELAELATEARPGLLVLYHQLTWGNPPQVLLEEVKSKYKGKVLYGRDLDVF